MKKPFALLFSILSTTLSIHAASGIPTYTPGGALPSISAQDALNPTYNTSKNGWWYFTGLLNDQQNAKPADQHSLQLTMIKIPFLLSPLGVGSIAFTFQNTQGQTLYLWNNYDNKTMLSHFPIGNLTWKPAGSGQYNIDISPFKSNDINPQTPTFQYHFSKDPADSQHIAGDFGAHYQLNANGLAQIGGAQHEIQTVYYQFHATMIDERGVMPEGYAGYVGPLPWDKNVAKGTNSSWELTMPQLKLTAWQMTITPADNIKPLLNSSLSFSNNNTAQDDTIWLDRQILYPADQHNVLSALRDIAQQKMNGIHTPSVSNLSDTKELYHGTWMSFCFNKKPFKGYCGNVAAFWQPNTTTAVMDSDQNAKGGFMNLYLPVNATHYQSFQAGGVIGETLFLNQPHPIKPFRIQNASDTTFTSKISGNHYAQSVYVTFHNHTPVNALLTAKEKTKNVLLKFTAISQQTEDVILTNSDAFFEGAAIVSVCKDKQHCTPVGTGFMEQMGYGA